MTWLKKLVRRAQRMYQSAPSRIMQGTPPEETPQQKIMEGICPFCDEEDAFLSGPQGGISTNVMCKFCGTRINVAVFGGHLISSEVTHGPQRHIWGGFQQTKSPPEDHVKKVSLLLEAK